MVELFGLCVAHTMSYFVVQRDTCVIVRPVVSLCPVTCAAAMSSRCGERRSKGKERFHFQISTRPSSCVFSLLFKKKRNHIPIMLTASFK